MSFRKPLLAANWKMAQENWAGVSAFLDSLQKLPKETFADIDTVICPSYFHLGAILSAQSAIGNRQSAIRWGSQDIHYEKKGAYTGCVSAAELADLGVRYAILGHSERRRYFKESSDVLGKKLALAYENKLIPIFCVGETKEEREQNKTFQVLEHQLAETLSAAREKITHPEKLVVAYEPVWAIGTGLIATAEQAQEVHAFIRQWLAKNFGPSMAAGIRILYGGSVTPDNFESVAQKPDVDGGLVGGASLKPDSFFKLLEILKNAKFLGNHQSQITNRK